jgi:hypothetical protein
VVLIRTDVSEELSGSFVTVTRIGELGTTLAVTRNPDEGGAKFLRTSVLTRATQHSIPEDTILTKAHLLLFIATLLTIRYAPELLFSVESFFSPLNLIRF